MDSSRYENKLSSFFGCCVKRSKFYCFTVGVMNCEKNKSNLFWTWLNLGQVMWCMLKYMSNSYIVNWNLMTEGQTFEFLMYFGKLSHHSKSIAQWNFYINLKTILLRFNHQKLNQFEGLQMVKIIYIHKVLLSEWNTCFWKFKY